MPETTFSAAALDINRLPTLPAIAMEAIKLMEGEDSNFKTVAELLRNDQVLATRIIHYANNAYSRVDGVSSLGQAVSLLGFNAVSSIILSATILDGFTAKFADRRASLVRFWLHSVGVAVTAETLANRLGFPAPEEAYLAGLLHDLGKLVAFLQWPQEFAALTRELEQQGSFSVHGSLPLNLEEKHLGSNHVELGRQVVEHWRFPASLVNAIWLHHQPVTASIIPETANLGALIRFADVLCVCNNIGSGYMLATGTYGHEHYHFALEQLLAHHNLAVEEVDGMMADIHARVEALGPVMGFWDEEQYRRLVASAKVSLGLTSINLDLDNREQAAANRVMDASCALARNLHARLETAEAARMISQEAQRAFGVSGSLCLIQDPERRSFVGGWLDQDQWRPLELPGRPADQDKYAARRGSELAEIEIIALRRLRRASDAVMDDQVGADAPAAMLAGSRFMASFFIADTAFGAGGERVNGQLLVDFSEDAEPLVSLEVLQRHFATFALTAGSIVDRLLLTRHLTRQAAKLAESSRKTEESQRQLFHSHRLATVGQMAAGAAHEINNPLTIISLNVQFLMATLRNLVDDDATLEPLGIIDGQVHRITKIIQDLRDFSRPSQPELASASIAEIIDRVVRVLGDRVSLRNIEIKRRLASDLPAIKVDPLQIEQVIMNLLINASHAMPSGGTITLAATSDDRMLHLSCRDTGSGIDPKHLSRIFDPFFTTKKEGEGSGLGLAICNSIVEHNGGSMGVRSTPGKGTTFTVSLPVDKSRRLLALKESLKETPQPKPVKRRGHRILVIDDERLLNRMLQKTLREAGYEVDGAYDGVEGIGKLRFSKYDLILLDIRMPRKDGLEVLQFVRDEFPEIKVVIVSGLASRQEIVETVKLGAFACLKKPFVMEKVLEIIRKALQPAAK